ncbi:MAG: phosphotransferase, partial [Pirellulaceae bacterium]
DYAPPSDEASITCQVVRIEQYHTSVRYGQHSVMKYLRRTEEGLHPDVDMGRLLTETRPTSAAAPLLAALEYRQHRRDPVLLGVMHQFVAHEGDAWQFVLDHLSNFFERVAAHPDLLSRDKALSLPPSTAIWESGRQPPPLALELVGDLLPMASLLGQRLAELHMTLASPADDPSFRPEPFSQAYQRAVYQSMRSVTLDVFHALELHAAQLPEPIRELAARVATREHDILGGFQQLLARPLTGARIRCHGDCHLGQVLFTGKDFIFIDFEGVPSRSIGERRIKRSALRDVVDMLRSFDDAAHATLHGLASGRGRPIGFIREEDRKVLRPWALAWHSWVGNSFVQAYLATARDARFLPQRDDDVFRLFQAFLIEEVLVHLRERLVRHPQTISHLLEFLDQLPIRHV